MDTKKKKPKPKPQNPYGDLQKKSLSFAKGNPRSEIEILRKIEKNSKREKEKKLRIDKKKPYVEE